MGQLLLARSWQLTKRMAEDENMKGRKKRKKRRKKFEGVAYNHSCHSLTVLWSMAVLTTSRQLLLATSELEKKNDNKRKWERDEPALHVFRSICMHVLWMVHREGDIQCNKPTTTINPHYRREASTVKQILFWLIGNQWEIIDFNNSLKWQNVYTSNLCFWKLHICSWNVNLFPFPIKSNKLSSWPMYQRKNPKPKRTTEESFSYKNWSKDLYYNNLLEHTEIRIVRLGYNA